MQHLFSHPGVIAVFILVVLVMLSLDLGVFNKEKHAISNKEAAIWTSVWVGSSMLFSLLIYYILDRPFGGAENFLRYQTAYWIEEALSVDNLFVFVLVFRYFKIPKKYQHEVLFWGILGAVVFRAVFIFAGVEIIQRTYIEVPFLGSDPHTGLVRRVNIVLSAFGVFLLYAGIKSWKNQSEDETEKDLSQNIAVRIVHKFYKVSNSFAQGQFFTIENGIKMVTPLFVALAVIEITDLMFAVDSIPAIFAIAPDDPFILYTSNIFAILGLRSMYFLLANSMDMFSKLHYGLAVILCFIGLKMLIAPFYEIESLHSLLFITLVLVISIILSFIQNRKSVTL